MPGIGDLNRKTISGRKLATYKPPTESCEYLGMLVYLVLHWWPQVEKTMQINKCLIADKWDMLIASARSAIAMPWQCLPIN